MARSTNNSRKAPSVSDKTRNELWVSADNQCSKCGMWLKQDKGVIGEVAHIVDESLDGFYRPDSEEKILPLTERNKIDNLILLCNNCHQTIDDKSNLQIYTIEKLREIKKSHEDEINERRSKSPNKELQDFYKDLVQKWVELADFENWKNWTDNFNLKRVVEPLLLPEDHEKLEKLFQWLFTRIWSEKAERELVAAFDNFFCIITAFFDVSHKAKMHWEFYNDQNQILRILVLPRYFERKRIREAGYKFDEKNFSRKTYEEHIKIIEEWAEIFVILINELTRAANYINTLIRQKIDSSFMLNEGLVVTNLVGRSSLEYNNKEFIYPFKESKDHKAITRVLNS